MPVHPYIEIAFLEAFHLFPSCINLSKLKSKTPFISPKTNILPSSNPYTASPGFYLNLMAHNFHKMVGQLLLTLCAVLGVCRDIYSPCLTAVSYSDQG